MSKLPETSVTTEILHQDIAAISDSYLSEELPRVLRYKPKQTVLEPAAKFAGLDHDMALKQAERCLPFDDLQVVRLYIEGYKYARIARTLHIREKGIAAVRTVIERSKEDVARFHIQNWEPTRTEEELGLPLHDGESEAQ